MVLMVLNGTNGSAPCACACACACSGAKALKAIVYLIDFKSQVLQLKLLNQIFSYRLQIIAPFPMLQPLPHNSLCGIIFRWRWPEPPIT